MADTVDDHEKLFLLEVLVDSLFISNSSLNLDKMIISNLAETCVLFQFLHYPPLVVCESDFIGSPAGRFDSSNITFKSGKSCFFSLRLPRGLIKPVPFDVNVSVNRKVKMDSLDKIDIGKTCIDMGEMFTELLRQNTDENCDSLPLSKTKKGTFEMKDGSGRTVGSLVAFLRLSCFGKLIITQFSLNKEDEKTFLFKGTDVNKFCTTGDEGRPCGDKPGAGVEVDSRSKQPRPEVAETRYGGSIVKQDTGYSNQQNIKAYPSFSDDMRDQRRGYPETAPYPTGMGYAPTPPSRYGGPGGGRGGLCDCPYPVPPSVMSKYTQRTDKNLGLTAGEVGLQDDQVIFQLPLKKPGEAATERDKQIDSSVYYKLTSAEETKEGRQKNTVHIKSDDLPGMGRGAVGPVSGLPVDDQHDVFLLKIGKKCDGDKKRNLELELRTPKMKEPKPPTSDQNTQYLESDCQPEGGKRGSKGGKGGKGKGSKSGKSGKGKGKKGKK